MSDPSSEVKLLLCFDHSSELALTIPLAQCITFANRPLKWLRFLGFIICGRQGSLSRSENGPELDYAAQVEACSYYFISDGAPRFADIDAIDNRTSNGSNASTGRVDFRQKLIERDGACVLTGDFIRNCDACHILPHSKGDDYMSNLFDNRHETYGLVDPLDGINDPRNGILLSVIFRRALDAGVMVFLKTPNFALTVDDIPYNQPPNAGSPANRLTLQYIRPSEVSPIVLQCGPHNSDARQPQDISQWPLSIIVDLSYASAVLCAWGPRSFTQYIRTKSKKSYYRDGVKGASEDRTAQVSRQPTDQTIKKSREARKARYEKRSRNKAQDADPVDLPTREDMLEAVFALWMQSARDAASERGPPTSNAMDVVDNESKVQTWLQSIEESTL